MWQGIQGVDGGYVVMNDVHIHGASRPHVLGGSRSLRLSSIQLHAGAVQQIRAYRLNETGREATHIEDVQFHPTPQLLLMGLVVFDEQPGLAMRLSVQNPLSPGTEVQFDIPEVYQIESTELAVPGCVVSSRYSTRVRLLLTGLQCGKEKRLPPIVFLPGLGTSFHPQGLSVPDPEKALVTNWFIHQKTTPAYIDMMTALEKQGRRVIVIPYNWRLSPRLVTEKFLLPLLVQLRNEGIFEVDVIAHSYGGLVTSHYLADPEYGGEVRHFVSLGTPYQGAVKAYPVWEAGEIPEDWRIMHSLVRYYQYAQKTSFVQALRRSLPSTQHILPTPQRFGAYCLSWVRPDYRRVADRSLVTVLRSTDRATADMASREVSDCTRELWPDGEGVFIHNSGDGTVPEWGSIFPLEGVPQQTVAGGHSELPRTALPEIQVALGMSATESPATVSDEALNHLVFDCPISVRIETNQGEFFLSADGTTQGKGAVLLASEDLLMALLPESISITSIEVTALATTPVRAWYNDGEILTFSLKKGEKRQLLLAGKTLNSVVQSTPISPSPSVRVTKKVATLSVASSPMASPRPSPLPILEEVSSPSPVLSTTGSVLSRAVLGLVPRSLPSLSQAIMSASTASPVQQKPHSERGAVPRVVPLVAGVGTILLFVLAHKRFQNLRLQRAE
jgi:pimeloyl-ACP methyl ester carboxylesterase